MAKSPSHKLGQMIGNLLEMAIGPSLEQFCDEFGLYLDYQRARKARSGKKVRWKDRHGNSHDLDFVIERGGTDQDLGDPVGFIEVAWRRYSKHSRNKAQEIQGAILPLVDTFEHLAPFQGVVLGGVFTEGSLSQLRSHGFSILHFEYQTIVDAFSQHDLDILFDEDTSKDELEEKVNKVEEQLDTDEGLDDVAATLRELVEDDLRLFHEELRQKIIRRITGVVVVKLFGEQFAFPTVQDAVYGLNDVHSATASDSSRGYEVLVNYSNGDQIRGCFAALREVKSFLRGFVVDGV